MKNLFRLSTGIVFIMAILIAMGCKSENKDPKGKNKNEVIIILADYEINGEIHLKMYDLNGNWAIDALTTDVMPGDTVTWMLNPFCGIKNIIHIKGSDKKIFKGKVVKPGQGQSGKKLKFGLDEDIEGDEKYEIKFKMKEDKGEHNIDPMLRVPPDQPDTTAIN